MLNIRKPLFMLNWCFGATFLGLLYYLPYYFKNLPNGDTALDPPILLPITSQIKGWLLIQAKPLYGINNFLYSIVSSELLTLMGVIVFAFATIKFVELILPSLNNKLKPLVFLLLFVNPFLYFERGLPYQFLVHSLITVLYYFSFYVILKYKEKPFSLAKLFYAYTCPIGSIVIGLSYFMPIFFHFIVLCMVMVLKRHIENPFKSIADVLCYAKDFLIIVILGGIIYVIEINIGWHLLDSSLADFLNNEGERRGSELGLKGRLITLLRHHNNFVNYICLVATTILLLSKRNMVNIFLFFMVGFVWASSDFFYIFLDMRPGTILRFANYYLTFFIVGLLLVKYQASLKARLLRFLATATILFLAYFYFSSYSYYYVNNKQHKELEELAHSINNYVITTYKTNDSPAIRLVSAYNPSHISSNHKIRAGFFNVIGIYHAKAFYGKWLGLPHITSYAIWPETYKTMSYIEDEYLRNKCLELVKAGKIFPDPESVFLYKNVYHVVN